MRRALPYRDSLPYPAAAPPPAVRWLPPSPAAGRDKLCGKQTGFEFSRRQIGQVDALCQPDACRFQIINSLWTAQAARSMSIQSLLYVKYMNNSNLFLWASPSFLPLCAKSGEKPAVSRQFFRIKRFFFIPAPAGDFPMRWPAALPLKSRSVPVQKRNSEPDRSPPCPRTPHSRGRNTRRSQSRRQRVPVP